MDAERGQVLGHLVARALGRARPRAVARLEAVRRVEDRDAPRVDVLLEPVEAVVVDALGVLLTLWQRKAGEDEVGELVMEIDERL